MMNRDQVTDFVFREARLIDDREWDQWLTLYHPDVEYWMPCWDDDDELTTDPQSEISLIYYANRNGLEDRVYRLKTERAGSNNPAPRTTHQCSNIEVLSFSEQQLDLRFNFHTLSFRNKEVSSFFGTNFYSLDLTGEQALISKKKIVLNNDYIHQVIDFYHV